MDAPPHYIPGVCNIGTAEAANRRRIGVGGSVATVLVAGVLVVLGAPWPAYLLLTLPAFVAATGFLQARSHFCPGYGMSGASNFSDELGASAHAQEAEALAADRARSKQLTLHAGLMGFAVALAASAVAALAA